MGCWWGRKYYLCSTLLASKTKTCFFHGSTLCAAMLGKPLQDIPRIINEARFTLPQSLFLQSKVWHCCTKTASSSVAEWCQHSIVRVVQKGNGLVFMVKGSALLKHLHCTPPSSEQRGREGWQYALQQPSAMASSSEEPKLHLNSNIAGWKASLALRLE